MSQTTHELHDEFPAQAARISLLKASDGRFLRLTEEYRATSRALHRAEARIEPVSDTREAELRRRRRALKDEIARILSAPPAPQRARWPVGGPA